MGTSVAGDDPRQLAHASEGLLKERPNIDELVVGAWRAFENAAALPARVCPSIPILFFGDLQAYFDSATRVLTVGLNPSRREFPSESDFQRFPIAEGIAVSEVNPYLDALSTYFRTHPYRNWFRSFEPMLNGLGASYYEGRDSTALHTDICTPVATDPTWSRLDRASRRALEAEGSPLLHGLLEALRPQIVVLSVAKHHLSRIQFKALGEWKVVHVFEQTGSGAPRKRPVRVSVRWYEIIAEPTLLIFVPAAQMPLGLLGSKQKREGGEIALEVMRRGLDRFEGPFTYC